MGASTVIEWTDATWNPWRGCSKVSPGCAECYMFRDQRRYGRDPEVVVRCGPGTFYAPLRSKKWRETAMAPALAEARRPRVFTCSWSDFFHPDADKWRADAWDVIRSCPEFDWQILTKRPQLVAERLPADWGDGWPHVWLGVSIENRRFIHRADQLRALPAAVRFISAEPLLGPLVHDTDIGMFNDKPMGPYLEGDPYTPCWSDGKDLPELELDDIDWLIVGGESGGPARRRLVDDHNQPRENTALWVDALRYAAACAETAFLFKQWGGPRPDSGGRLLDGREWSEFPTSKLPAVST